MATRSPTPTTDRAKVYTIRKNGVDIVRSSILNCGYSADDLQSLRAAGYELFADDKPVGPRQTKKRNR